MGLSPAADLLNALIRRVSRDAMCPFYVLTDLREIANEIDKAAESARICAVDVPAESTADADEAFSGKGRRS